MIIAAGASLLPACHWEESGGIVLKNIPITGTQQKLLAALTDAIIPTDKNFIGAADIKADEFTLIMLDDCASPEDQQKFAAGLKSFDKACQDKYGQSFGKLSPLQKQNLLTALEAKKEMPEDATRFYATVKRYSLQCFTSSKEYMNDVLHYTMVPGPNFKGCVKV
jgi:hypothetical protein